MNAVQEVASYRYMTLNLCNTPQMDKDIAYRGLRFKDRLDKIISVISILAPDIIGFQEVRDYEDGVVMADLWRKLRPLGYRMKFQEGNPHEFAVYNVIAYKTAKLWPQSVTSWWNSDNPETVSCSYGNGWPRAVLAIEFYPIKQVAVERFKQESGEKVTFNRPDPDFSGPSLLVVNSHLGLGIGTSHLKEKVLSNQTTVEKIKQYVGRKPMFVVSLGDFNSFRDSKLYEEEMNVYRENGFIDGVTSSSLKNQDDIPITGNFVGFSPDKGMSPDNRFGFSLCHTWYRTFNNDGSWNINVKKCFAVTLTGDPLLDNNQAKHESQLLKAPDGSSLRDKYPSDHLPVILDIEVNRNLQKKRISANRQFVLKATLALVGTFFLARLLPKSKP